MYILLLHIIFLRYMQNLYKYISHYFNNKYIHI